MPRFVQRRFSTFAVSVVLCAFSWAMFVQTARGQEGIDERALRQIQALIDEKDSRTLVQRKIASQLIYALKMSRAEPIADGVPSLRASVDIGPDGKTLVDMKANVTEALLTAVVEGGGEVLSSFAQYNAIRARIPLDQVEFVASFPEVKFIRPAHEAITNKDNTSEGDHAHRADIARSTYVVDGTGVSIGVLSDGVSTLAARKASGDLPGTVTVLSGQAGSGDEGTAMLEIVYDLAPGANLFFATAFGSMASFAQNILDLRDAGCDIIVDDVYYFAEPVFQDGTIAQAVNTVTEDGALYFSSAGNSGNLNDGTSGVWEGDFAGMAAPPVVGGTAHDFGGGTNYNTITDDSPSYFTLQWSDPAGGSGNDYDLYLLNGSRTTVWDSSTNVQDGNDDPLEYIDSRAWNDTGGTLVIIQKSSSSDRFLHLNTHRGELAIATDGQTSGHSAAEDAFSVAAVDVATAGGGVFVGGATNPVETFSSDGPRRVFYEANGTAITPGDFSSTGGEVRQKPDIAAADGVQTATPGFNPFYGTSAAAPHAAAIAALVTCRFPLISPADTRTLLTSTALDIEDDGVDRDSGYGIVDAYESATAIRLISLGVTGIGDQVLVEWETEPEHDTAGFNVLRAESAGGPWVKLNEHLIPSQGSSWGGASYTFSDENREPGTVYWYCVEGVSMAGGTTRYPSQLIWDDGLSDADGDEMPDVWEQGLGIDTGNGADASADADADGATNLQEYLAGTSPVDAADSPRLRIEWAGGGNVPVLTWRGRAARTYRLVTADSLAELLGGSPTVLFTTSATSDSPMRFEDNPPAQRRTRFYRLIISPPR